MARERKYDHLQLVVKNGNCQNKIDIFLQFFHGVKPSYERYSRGQCFFANVSLFILSMVTIIVVYLTSSCVNWAFFWHEWASSKAHECYFFLSVTVAYNYGQNSMTFLKII
jgi:hypothetical protein